MIENLIFSINVALPIFIIMALGKFIKHKNIINDNFVSVSNNLIFKIALPVTLFENIYKSDFSTAFDLKLILFCAVVTIISFSAVWIISEIFIKDKTLIGTFVQGACRSNYAFIGLPFVNNMIGLENSSKAVLVLATVVPIFNVYSIIVLSIRGKDSIDLNLKEIIFSILKNPLIRGIFIGILFSILGITLPWSIERSIYHISSMTSAITIICIGASLSFKGFDSKLYIAIIGSIVKVAILPVIFTPIAFMLGFGAFEIIPIFIFLCAPSAVSSYIMAEKMGGDTYIASSMVFFSTILSFIPVMIGSFIFKTMGLI